MRPRPTWAALLLVLNADVQAFGAGPETEPPRDPAWLRIELERLRGRDHLPALAASLVVEGRVAVASAVGVRKVGSPERATRDDAFHIGSITKTMTATMIGALVDRGRMRWDMTLGELFPELLPNMQPLYRGVTVTQLLSHTSGMPYTPRRHETAGASDVREEQARRYQYVEFAVVDPPEAPPGAKMIYGGGPVIAACAAERITGRSYEQLMREFVFDPLRMRTYGYGNTEHRDRVDAPWEHTLREGVAVPVEMPASYAHDARAPVGKNGHSSVIDLGAFAAAHLRGDRGDDPLLSPETFRFLHTAVIHGWGPGWEVTTVPWAEGRVLAHNGSNGRNESLCHVLLDEGYAVSVVTNVGGHDAGAALGKVTHFLATRFHRGEAVLDERPNLPGNGPVPPRPDVPLGRLRPVRATTGFGHVEVGKNAAGGVIDLDGEVDPQGVGVHAPSELVYQRRPGYRRFVARVGIDAKQDWHGTVTATVFLGDRRLHESPVLRGGDVPWNLDVPLPPDDGTGAQVRLVVGDGGDGHSWDLTDWIHAGFVERP